jgi:uncharacterized membrane protein
MAYAHHGFWSPVEAALSISIAGRRVAAGGPYVLWRVKSMPATIWLTMFPATVATIATYRRRISKPHNVFAEVDLVH